MLAVAVVVFAAERERVEIEDCDDVAAAAATVAATGVVVVVERRARFEERVAVAVAVVEEEELLIVGAAEVASARFRLRVSIQKRKPPRESFRNSAAHRAPESGGAITRHEIRLHVASIKYQIKTLKNQEFLLFFFCWELLKSAVKDL